MSYYWFNIEEAVQKAEEKYHNCGGKKKLLSVIRQTEILEKKRQEISTETCQEKKKKQKSNIAEIDTRKLKKNMERGKLQK